MANIEGPYLTAALLCERVIEEKDGTKSAIRIIDRITKQIASPNPPREMEPFDYDLSLLVSFKAGYGTRGVHRIKLTFVRPSGESNTAMEISANFEGEEDRGVDLIAPMKTRFEETGIYWIEVHFNGDFVTRIPMRVTYIPQIIPAGPTGPAR